MLPNWLTGSQQGQQNNNAEARHVVLGTPLHAPLMDDQEKSSLVVDASGVLKKVSGDCPESSQQLWAMGGRGNSSTTGLQWQNRSHRGRPCRLSAPAIDVSDLLKLFWECHDPTQGDRQGNDQGSHTVQRVHHQRPSDGVGPCQP